MKSMPNSGGRVILIGLALLPLTQHVLSADYAEPGYRAEGTFTKVDASGKEMPWTDFAVSVLGEKSQVSNLYFNGELLESGSDGTNSFFLNKMAVTKRGDSNAWEWGSISAGAFPARDLTPGQVCWLAFCAFPHVLSAVKTLPLEAFQQNAGFLHYQMTPSSGPPYLPQQVRWYGSNYWYLLTTELRSRRRVPYTNGFLAGEYVVTSTTNCGVLQLPLTFDVSVFMPSLQGNVLQKEDVSLVETLRGRVLNVTAIGRLVDARPQLGPRAQVEDFRLPRPAGRHFLLTRLNGKWPEESDPDFRRYVESARIMDRLGTVGGRRSHKFVTGIVILLIVGSSVLLWKAGRSSGLSH